MHFTAFKGLFFTILISFLAGIASASEVTISSNNPALQASNIQIEKPYVTVKNIETRLIITILSEDKNEFNGTILTISAVDSIFTQVIEKGTTTISFVPKEKTEFYYQAEAKTYIQTINPVPLWMSILPPLIAILIALIFKEVFTALFLGIFSGTFLINFFYGDNFFLAIIHGIQRIVDTYILQSLNDNGHLSIIIFSMLIGAMVNLITRNGGMNGVVKYLSRFANTPRSGQFVTWLLGILIFFDDYANTLVVGNTMRPVTDKLQISREKLSYIVDSTAAPMASIAFVTTWIGAELSYIQDGINVIGLNETPYNVFINSLQFAFYPILALLFILILIWRNKDFGPMSVAEIKARNKGLDTSKDEETSFSNKLNDLETESGIKAKAYNALIPVLVVVLGTIAGLVVTGLENTSWNADTSFARNLSNIIGSSDSYRALLWSSMAGVLTAVILTVGGRILPMKKTIDSLINGFRTMLTAILILIMAWSIALITQHLHTAEFISHAIVNINLPPQFVPALTFILAALVAFSTGTSWGTMAILYPLIIPASWIITQQAGMDYDTSLQIFYNVVSTVLAGAVLGDHCSPISDTTILSSLASSCNHIDHVKSQLPYAITVGAVAVFVGIIPSAFGIPSWILFIFALIILFVIVEIFGKKNLKAVSLSDK